MKIAIIGSHSTGKTTLCNDFAKKHQEYFLIPEIARVFGIEKIPKTLKIQKQMMQTQKIIQSYHFNFISDRSILDFGIYSMNRNFIKTCLKDMQGMYDFIFFVPIRFPIVDDGFRNTDEIFQNKIDDMFRFYMPVKTIIIESVPTEARIKEMEDYIYGM